MEERICMWFEGQKIRRTKATCKEDTARGGTVPVLASQIDARGCWAKENAATVRRQLEDDSLIGTHSVYSEMSLQPTRSLCAAYGAVATRLREGALFLGRSCDRPFAIES